MNDAPPSEGEEGRPGIGRVEAFSDGVMAIIVTIMVLELHPPLSEGMEKLWTLWPIFLAYVLSYAYVAIYWANHHRLFSHAIRITNGLVWSNMLLLFALSLVPFATAYLGEHRFSRDSVLIYLTTMLLPSVAYVWLQSVIRRTGRQHREAAAYHRQTIRKGLFATFLYGSGIALSFVAAPLGPWLGIACAALVALLWFLPRSPLDRLFEGRAGQEAR